MTGPARKRGYRDWYNTTRWRTLREYQLHIEPLCRLCLARGQVVAATVADHIVPHKGDWNAFVTGKLQSLCVECHNGRKRTEDIRGYQSDIGADGWPLDPRHPAYRGR
jgi:5-methylcytosine-specific restriction enzyme A